MPRGRSLLALHCTVGGQQRFVPFVVGFSELTPPLTAVLLRPSTVSSDPSPTFQFSCVDASPPCSYRYSLDGNSTWSPVTGSQLTLSWVTEAAHTLTVKASDRFGNQELPGVDITWTGDYTPPLTRLLVHPLAVAGPASVFTFGCDGNGGAPCSYRYLLNGATTWTAVGSGQSLAEGGVASASTTITPITIRKCTSSTTTFTA